MEKDIEISKGVLLKLGFETDDEKIWYFKKKWCHCGTRSSI